MKIVRTEENTILQKDVSVNHIVILLIKKRWYILIPHATQSVEFYAHRIDENFTNGSMHLSNYNKSFCNSLDKWIEYADESYAFLSFKEAAKFIYDTLTS